MIDLKEEKIGHIYMVFKGPHLGLSSQVGLNNNNNCMYVHTDTRLYAYILYFLF